MRLWFLLSVVFLAMASCVGFEEEATSSSGRSVLYGEFPDLAGQVILLKRDDYTRLGVDTIRINESGFFEYAVYLEKPEYFSVQINRAKVLLYMQPRDSIAMSGDVKRIPTSIRYSGSSVAYNDYLIRWIDEQLKFQSTISEVFGSGERQAVRVLDSLKREFYTHLDDMKANYSGIDEFFYSTERARVLYTWALNMQSYPGNHAYVNKDFDYEPSPEFYNFLAELTLNDSSMIHIPVYRKFLEDYIYYRMEDAYKKDSTIIERHGSYARFRIHTLTEHIRNRQIIDYISYTSMKQHVSYDGVKDYESLYPYFDSLCTDSVFKNDIDRDLEPWSHLHKGKPSRDFTFINHVGDSVSLSDFQGKYVFIDVWATWCTPCLNEVPSLRLLERDMADNNIVFVSISVDQDKKKWSNFVRDNNFTGIQLHAGHDDVLRDFYKIKGIPRFMLIDPDGNIVESSSDRPSMNIGPSLLQLPGI